MILGYIGIIDYYVLRQGLNVAPKRTLSDVCEHLFSMMQHCAGATNNVMSNSAHATCAKDGIIQQCRNVRIRDLIVN